MSLILTLNGKLRSFVFEESGCVPTLADLIAELGLRVDRIALELNGVIVPRAEWVGTTVSNGDRVELVHFVGGGLDCDGTKYSAPRLKRG